MRILNSSIPIQFEVMKSSNSLETRSKFADLSIQVESELIEYANLELELQILCVSYSAWASHDSVALAGFAKLFQHLAREVFIFVSVISH